MQTRKRKQENKEGAPNKKKVHFSDTNEVITVPRNEEASTEIQQENYSDYVKDIKGYRSKLRSSGSGLTNPDTEASSETAEEPATSFNDFGYKMTAFNMDEERKEGLFDEYGFYIMKGRSMRQSTWGDEETDEEIHDPWLDSLPETNVVDNEQNDEEVKTNDVQTTETEESDYEASVKFHMEALIDCVGEKDTAADKLRNLRKGKKSKKLNQVENDILENVTNHADFLMMNGFRTIYFMNKAEINKLLEQHLAGMEYRDDQNEFC